jgi:hypothetical protein
VAWLLLTEFLYLLSFSNPSPEAGRIFAIGIAIALISFAVGIPLVLIGDYISPPDPWLDFWLNPWKFRKSLKPPIDNESVEKDGGIWATIASDGDWRRLGIRGKCLVRFERSYLSYLVLEQPGKDLVMIQPKKVSRTSNVTLLLDTGSWGYGKITFAFDSASDADTVEREAAKLVARS